IELGLAGALGYLFVRPAQQVAGTATTDQVKVLEDQLYALQLREQDIDENSSRITALEGAAEEFVTEEEFAAGISELQDVTEQISGDSDNDGLSDYAEIVVYGTDVDLADTDGDGFTDGEEVAGNYNPKGPGRAEGLEAGMAYITQLWDGDVETDVVEDAGFVLDLTEEGVLDGVWSFADETTTYDAVLTGEYTFQVTGDRLVGTATVETTSAEGVATQGTVELDGSVNRATGVIRLTIEFGTAYVPSILAGERVVATVLGDARAVDVEATGKTMEEGSADLMESLPEEIATPSSGSATEDQDPPAIP
ncbi:MAG: hypothetical protein KC653_01215, partial [Candidatus Andersenbacteria bacterium]|nr:hypothetical protein [Candidatus Andersenbacteria bacterium]